MDAEKRFDRDQVDLTIIITNWDGEEVLLRCLDSVVRHSGALRSEVIVFDNGSTDGSVKLADQYRDRLDLRIIRSQVNIGYARACNRAAASSSAPFLLLLNNDAELTEDLDPALEYLGENPNVAVSQGPLLTRDGLWVDSVGTLMTRWGFLRHLAVGEPVSHLPLSQAVFSVKGTAMFVRRFALGDLGLFDDDAFAYFEETDLCWRLQTMGWDITYDRHLPTVFHQGAFTAQRLPSLCEYHLFKNRLRSILKNAQSATLLDMLPRHVLIILASCVSGCFNGSPLRIVNVLRAVGWNLSHAKETLQLRRIIQNGRQCNDAQIFAKVAVDMTFWDFLRQGRDYRHYLQQAW
jgi:GT2 family glycosyltransferase